jgi:hypothetical protein
MSEFSTEDCKKKLMELYPQTQAKFWKRTKKYKNDENQWQRDFDYTLAGHEFSASLKEAGDILVEVSHQALQKDNGNSNTLSPVLLRVIGNTVTDLSRFLMGTHVEEALQDSFTSSNAAEEHFLLILEKTINWNQAKDERSTFDFSQKIDFNSFVLSCHNQGINLLQSYVEYIANQIMWFMDQDETYVPYHMGTDNFDDSLPDMVKVLTNIRSGYEQNNIMVTLSQESVVKVINNMKEAKEFLEYADDESYEQVANEAMKAMKYLLKQPLKNSTTKFKL